MFAVPDDPAAPRPVESTLPPPARVGRERTLVTEFSGKALGSLILGMLSFLLPVVLSLPAFIVGVLAIRDISRSGGQLLGKALAYGGITTAFLGNFSIIVLFSVWSTVRAREVAFEASKQNLSRLAKAMHRHNKIYGSAPANATYRERGGRGGRLGRDPVLLSWRVRLLLSLGHQELFDKFKQDEPWDSPHNLKLLPLMPKVYAPVFGNTPPGHTHYQVFTGPKTPFKLGVGPRIPATFRDGTSNTILIIEADYAVPWTEPADVDLLGLRRLPQFGKLWGDGFLGAMADGSTRFISKRVSEPTLRMAIDPSDGGILAPNWERGP
jgi:hypothetical protein